MDVEVVDVTLVATPASAGLAWTAVITGATQATVLARLRNSRRVVSFSAMVPCLPKPNRTGQSQ